MAVPLLSRWRASFLVATLFLGATAVAWADDWPQWLGPRRDGVWREKGLLDKFPPGGPKILWRTPLGTGYSGPSEADGRVYVMDRQRPLGSDGKPLPPTRKGHRGNERVLCLDAASGKVLWQHEYDCPYKVSYPNGPRTTPLVAGGRVYTLGTMGDLLCLDAKSGDVRWAKNLAKEYNLDAPPVWGWSANPLLDGELLYCTVGGEGSAVVAFHKDTGKEVWKALSSEEIGYSPPMIFEAGGKRQLIIWLSESVNSLDPATGKVYWTQQFPVGRAPQRPAVNIATVRVADNKLLVTTYYHGSLMLQLDPDKPAASVLWKGKSHNPSRPDGLHGLMAAPWVQDGYVYGVSGDGELCCLDAATGKKLWQTYAATGNAASDCGTAFIVPQGDRFVLFNDLGDLILAHLSPKGYKEIDRAHILEPVEASRGRKVVWSHPAFARRCVFARNNKEMVCVSMAAAP
jgi:outer membrane protein assembly factor BamB